MIRYIFAVMLGLSLCLASGQGASAAQGHGIDGRNGKLLVSAASDRAAQNLNDDYRYEIVEVDEDSPVLVDEQVEVVRTAAQDDATVSGAPISASPAPQESFLEKNWLWLFLACILLAMAFYGVRRRQALKQNTLFVEFPELNQRFQLRPGTMLLGSSPDGDISVDEPSVGNVHAELCVGAECTIRERLTNEGVADMLSTKGVLLNGKRVEGTTRLSPGDVLQIGATRAIIRSGKQAA